MADVLGKKISELAETTDLAGLYTIGSDRNNQSKKVPLQFVKEAADYANAQGDYAKGVGDTIQGNTGVNEYPAFSSSTQYAAGSVVRYNNKLYRFTALHPAGAWVGTDAIETSIKAETDVKLTELESETSYRVEVNDANCIFYRQPLMMMANKDIVTHSGEVIDSNGYSSSKPIYNIDITKPIYVSGTSYRYLYCYSDDGYVGRIDASTGVVLNANGSYANTKFVRVLCSVGEENDIWVGYVPTSENYNPIKGYTLGFESETNAKFNDLESIVGQKRLNPGINLFALNTGKQYVFTNNSEFNFSIGYYKSIDDANADINYVRICDLQKGNSFLFVATEDAPITYITNGVGYSCIVETSDGLIAKMNHLGNIREDVDTLIDDKSYKLSAYEITNEYIVENGKLGISNNYTAYKYRIGDREKDSVIRATIGSIYSEDAAIAFYNSTTLNDTTCIKTIPGVSGVIVYEQEIPTEAIVVVISTRNNIFAEDTAEIYHPKSISLLRDIIYSVNLKSLSRSNSYIEKDGGRLESSINYTAFYYGITSKLWGTMLTAIAGANSTDDAAIGFYSENSPAPKNCIKTIPSVIGTHTYKVEIPTGTQCVVVSTRTSVYSDESVRIDSSKPLIDTGFAINDNSINLRVGSFNVGNYDGTGMENGSEESKKAYRELLAHNTKTLIAFQADYDKFGNAKPREEIWGMFRSFEIRDASVFCDGFASDIRLNNARNIRYTGDTFSHNAFYVAELYIEDKTILVVSFHFDWQDKNRRALQYQQIIEYAESYDYAIIMGDTNCENYEDGVKLDNTVLIEEWDRFKENGYTMANNGYFGLYDTYTSGGVGEPIDNIFVKGNIVITNFEVIRKDWMYDHFLLFADLVIY